MKSSYSNNCSCLPGSTCRITALRSTECIVSPSPEPADGHRHKAGEGDEAGQRHQGSGQQEETDGGGQQGPGGDHGTGEGRVKEEHILPL